MRLVLLLILLIPYCGKAQKTWAPSEIFEELWTSFNERYAGFEPRGVDWKALKKRYQPSVSDQTSESELFGIFASMLSELNDAHVGMRANINGKTHIFNSFGFPDSTNIYQRYGSRNAFFEVVDKTLQSNGFNNIVPLSEKVSYAFGKSIGYLRVNSFSKSSKQFEEALDVLVEFNPKTIIIDIRLNPGGIDYDLHKLAGHFCNEKTVSHRKQTRITGTDEFSKLKTWHIVPTSGQKYLGPVIVLTSDFTVSAADVFAMAMKELPNVTIVGEPTNGSMSHVFYGKLSNGWKFSISNKQTFSSNMVNYEGKGVPPDVLVENIESNLSRDLALIKALVVIRERF